MIQMRASVPTANAAKYVMALCKQWGDRIDINFRERQGVVHFENAVATLTPASNELVVTILANDDRTAERCRSVMAQRIDRLAHREGPMKFDWHRLSAGELHAL